MGNILLKGGRVIDPARNFDRDDVDLLISGNKISNIGKISRNFSAGETIDCRGKIVCPGLIDMHVHLRTPGQEKKENLGSGSLAAIMGGFTSVLCMANTSPVIDNAGDLLDLLARIKDIDLINMYQACAVTKDLAGQRIVITTGCVKAASDDGRAIQNPEILAEAMKQCAISNLPLLLHCEDNRFSPDDKRSEYIYIACAMKIAEEHKLPIHIQLVSCAESIQLIREAKSRGVAVSCETAPQYFSLTKKDFHRLGANAKMNPPLRTEKDRQAVICGLADGTIDVIATDHAPHSSEEKNQSLDKAPYGVIGMEPAVPVVFSSLWTNERLTLMEIIRKLTSNPANILGLKGKGTLRPGSVADITVIDPDMRKKVDVKSFKSLSRNCPWAGKRLQGWPVMTIVGGRILMKDGELTI